MKLKCNCCEKDILLALVGKVKGELSFGFVCPKCDDMDLWPKKPESVKP